MPLLNDVIDKEEVVEKPQVVGANIENPSNLVEMHDMKHLATLLGFESHELPEHQNRINRIYEWAKKASGMDGGPESIMAIKRLIQDLGLRSTRGDLVRRLAAHASIDMQIRDLRKLQDAI